MRCRVSISSCRIFLLRDLKSRFHCAINYSFTPSQVKVVVGQVSLIQLDVGEETLPVFKINIYETYDPLTKLHDIAMLQVEQLEENLFSFII